MQNIKKKLREWTFRYLPSETLGTIMAMALGYCAYQLSHNLLVAALAGTWGENLGFYGYAVVREISSHANDHRHHENLTHIQKTGVMTYKTLRNILLEFGPSEVLDSFLLRPYFMWIAPQITGNLVLGLAVGKLLADIFFYIPTIIAFELKKRYFPSQTRS